MISLEKETDYCKITGMKNNFDSLIPVLTRLKDEMFSYSWPSKARAK